MKQWYTISLTHIFATRLQCVNTLRPPQNSRYFADDIFRWIFLNENVWISLKIPLEIVPQIQINNIPSSTQIMAWRRPGEKPLSEPWWLVYWRIYASLGINELTTAWYLSRTWRLVDGCETFFLIWNHWLHLLCSKRYWNRYDEEFKLHWHSNRLLGDLTAPILLWEWESMVEPSAPGYHMWGLHKMADISVFFNLLLTLNNLLIKQSICRCFKTPRRSCYEL